MAYALVGSLGAVAGGAAGGACSTAFGQSPTAGNLLVCWLFGGGASGAVGGMSAWTLGPAQTISGVSVTGLYYKIATGGDAAPTISAVTGISWRAQLGEFSGNPSSLPLDQSASAQTTALTTPLVTTTASADVALGELVIAVGSVDYSTGATKTIATTFNNGATATEATNNTLAIFNHYDFSYGITTGKSAADSASMAFTTTKSLGAAIMVASFKLAATGPPSTQGLLGMF